MSASAPVVHQYQQVLSHFRREGNEAPFVKRMSELISLLDFTTTLSSDAAGEEALSAALRIVLDEVQAARGAFLVRRDDGAFAIRASCGLPPGAPQTLERSALPDDLMPLEPGDEAHARHGLVLLCPIRRRDRVLGVLGLGPRAGGGAYGEEEQGFLRSVAACAATPIENVLVYDELRRANRKLSTKVFELHNLFDVSRELTGSFEEDAIHRLIATAVMGHFVVPRCALYLLGPMGLGLVHERGLRRGTADSPLPPEEASAALERLCGPMAVADLPDGRLRRRLEEARLALAVPLTGGARVEGVLAIGERASRTPFSAEDREFAATLARQAAAALEGARLNRLRVEKQRQDHELRIAREIQRSLFPPRGPEVRGFEVAGESRSCYEVGGDCYDWIPLRDGRLALVIADVAGKGTPAALLMASVHASVHALAGTAAPARVIERLNRFLFARTQADKYVTLFYAELEPESRRLSYVNAGHVPPYRVARDGTVGRLPGGGLALGFLDEVAYEEGVARLEPGELLAMVTDGVTEANSKDEREFGDERVVEALRAHRGRSAASILEGLVGAVDEWTGGAGGRDDLTAVIVKAS
jgi:sigma-B regulation protein RsbU (phosphoserine phosphatase)